MSLLVADYASDSDSDNEEQLTLKVSSSKNKSSTSKLSQLLPPPKNSNSSSNNNVNKSIDLATTNKKTIIYIPTTEKEEEEENRPTKRLKMGNTSSNLADLLPAPKNSYNPFHKKTSDQSTQSQSTLSSRVENYATNNNNNNINIYNNKILEKGHHQEKNDIKIKVEEEEEEEEEIIKSETVTHIGSFFRIGSSLKEEPIVKLPKSTIYESSPSSPTTMHTSMDTSVNNNNNSNNNNNNDNNSVTQLPELEDPNAMYAFGTDPNAYYQYYYQEQSLSEKSSSNQEVLDNDALSQLGGKRRGEHAGVNIVDIKQNDMLPSDEWRRHAIASQPKSMISSGAMEASTLQKKKNNIMALAAQARSMEHSLEERYANERVVKNEARKRYGF